MHYLENFLHKNWQSLSFDLQKKNFEDILNFYVSNKSEINQICPTEVHFMNKRFISWQVIIDGLRYVFVPGTDNFQTSYDLDRFVKKNTILFRRSPYLTETFLNYVNGFTINSVRNYHIEPFLVAVDALPVNGIPVGYYDLYDGRKIIKSSIEKKYSAELNSLLHNRHATEHFFMRRNTLFKLGEIFQKNDSLRNLIYHFNERNISLINATEFYYLKSGGSNTFFPWGDLLDHKTIDRFYNLPNRFGVKIKKEDNSFLMTDRPLRLMEGQIAKKGNFVEYIKFANFFDAGFVPDKKFMAQSISNNLLEYRPVIRIK